MTTSKKEGFYLVGTDTVAAIKTPDTISSRPNFELILIYREIFNSKVGLLSFTDLHSKIFLNNKVFVIGNYDVQNNLIDFGPVNDKNWRVKLALELPYLGPKFIKYWDNAYFEF